MCTNILHIKLGGKFRKLGPVGSLMPQAWERCGYLRHQIQKKIYHLWQKSICYNYPETRLLILFKMYNQGLKKFFIESIGHVAYHNKSMREKNTMPQIVYKKVDSKANVGRLKLQ